MSTVGVFEFGSHPALHSFMHLCIAFISAPGMALLYETCMSMYNCMCLWVSVNVCDCLSVQA